MIGTYVTFQYDDDFDRERVINVADKARSMFDGMPGLRFKFFTFDVDAAVGQELLRLGIPGRLRKASLLTSCVRE